MILMENALGEGNNLQGLSLRFQSIFLFVSVLAICEYLTIFDYIDDNPVAARLMARMDDWLYGRFHLRDRGCEGLLSNPPAWAD
jgi:hypothetical protein